MDEILHKIELLMFYNMISENHIIVDEGTFNLPMENHNNQRYTFTDDKEHGKRTPIEQNKIIFLNDIMEILTDLHTYIHENEPENTPIYFNKNELEKKIGDELSVNVDTEEFDGETEKTENINEIDKLTNEITDMDI